MASVITALPNLTPSPQGGQGAYGSVPGAIPSPTSTYGQAAAVIPNLPNLSAAAGGTVGSQLAGEVSPETQEFLQQKAAEYGIGMGLPSLPSPGTFTGNNLLRSLGLTSEQLQQQGVQNYQGILGTTAQTQVSPEIQSQIAEQNAINAAAPDPAAAAKQMLKTLQNFYDKRTVGVSGYPMQGAVPLGNPEPKLSPWELY